MRKLVTFIATVAFSVNSFAIAPKAGKLQRVVSACGANVVCQNEAVWRYISALESSKLATEEIAAELANNSNTIQSVVANRELFLETGHNLGFISESEYTALLNVEVASSEEAVVSLQKLAAVGGTGAELNPSAKRGLAKGACLAGVFGLAALVVVSSQWYVLPFLGSSVYCGPKITAKN